MRLPRTSIAALMGCILVLAVAFAALVRPTPLWAAVAFSGMMLALTYAVVAALFAKGNRRAFWAGFLVGGASYLFLQYGPFCAEHVGPYTLPTALLDIGFDALHDEPQDLALNSSFDLPGPVTPQPAGAAPPLLVPASPAQAPVVLTNPPAVSLTVQYAAPSQAAWLDWTSMNTSPAPVSPNTPEEFYRIGHSFLCLLVAVCFGSVAVRIARRSEEAGAPALPAVEPPAPLA